MDGLIVLFHAFADECTSSLHDGNAGLAMCRLNVRCGPMASPRMHVCEFVHMLQSLGGLDPVMLPANAAAQICIAVMGCLGDLSVDKARLSEAFASQRGRG